MTNRVVKEPKVVDDDPRPRRDQMALKKRLGASLARRPKSVLKALELPKHTDSDGDDGGGAPVKTVRGSYAVGGHAVAAAQSSPERDA